MKLRKNMSFSNENENYKTCWGKNQPKIVSTSKISVSKVDIRNGILSFFFAFCSVFKIRKKNFWCHYITYKCFGSIRRSIKLPTKKSLFHAKCFSQIIIIKRLIKKTIITNNGYFNQVWNKSNNDYLEITLFL